MDLSFVIRLVDQLTGPAAKVKKGMLDIGEAAKQGLSGAFKEGFSVENIENATKNAEAALRDARSRMIGAVGQAIAIAAPVIKAADFQDAFIDFANVAEIPVERMGEIEAKLIAATRTTGKNKSELLQILATYVGKGMGVDESLAAIEATGRASTATKSEISDMGNAGFAVMDNLKVGAAELAKAFDVMAATGKQGSFELKDMARNFPELTANASALQMKGVPAVASLAAALQIAMKSAGSADQAANNMSNFLGKITSPETVRNFKKMGIDIEKEMKTAAANGTDPLLHSLELIQKATGGDQFKMGELFADKQVLDFLRALIPNLQEYQRIRNEAGGASGVIDKDFANVVAGLKTEMKGLVTEVDNLFSAGSGLLPVVQDIVKRLTGLLRQVNDWTTANPKLTSTIVKVTAGLLSASVAMRTAAYGLAALRLGAIGLTSTFLKFQDGKNIATGWRIIAGSWTLAASAARSLGSAMLFMLSPLRNAVAGLAMLSASAGGGLGGAMVAVVAVLKAAAAGIAGAVAAISAPVWTLVALLAAAGFAIWKYWDRVSSFVSGFAGPFIDLFSSGLAKLGTALNDFIDMVGRAFGIDPGKIEAFKASIKSALDFSGLIDAAKTKLQDFWNTISGFFSQEKLSNSAKAGMNAAGRQLATDMLDGIKAGFEAIYQWFAGVPSRIRAAIGRIDVSDLITGWGPVKRWFGSEEQPAQIEPYRPAAAGAAGPGVTDADLQKTVKAVIHDTRPPVVNLTQHITGGTDPKAIAREANYRMGAAISATKSGMFNDGGNY
ncbi:MULTISPECIES: phage tail tape measure protein [unclassified Agrobacterium]|uniref:phage tail tape measure protein n=1 Tax=unclassified Agrobacterium TaxID=2632611 RepID=UPI00244C5C2E|nr:MULTISPECIES: phage tail tape measure protein [unclassified Agrobacterium]MDH0615161.1 phage tail tape measure protein [Agrobacterium sp. GD03872]MDH0698208.1 phage tail tape measure protein [Agrobacterium sp. GD03871]MDH1060234.1 phage tail tape measure protein [Agrobacterium sp. GD03992]MDH2211990.1 phage tail tape measure protein [Agrobacterium sp. GD03643]MDH2220297.1 phage tail tape measure protein [Agrobacterium sp. GD03638]